MSSDSFLWHDFETFGADPRRDRPCQFAAIRSNLELEPIEDPIIVYCRPADDLLPQPMACLITGITPQLARERGLGENEFAAVIHQAMSHPGTCSVGYNNFRFDDEVTRHLFWRNFFDPYAREYANGNSRFDLIDVMRMARALRPEGLNWPDRTDGKPSFRLEDLAQANGLDTSRAHDALADVEATLGLARQLKNAQPRLWAWALSLRHKHKVAEILARREILVHSSARFPADQCATSAILPLVPHPHYTGQWLAWNLRVDPEPFLAMSSELLADCLWTPAEDLPEELERLPIKLIRSNRCPMLSPMSVLDTAAVERLALDQEAVGRHARCLREQSEFSARLAKLYVDQPAGADQDAELALYAGFVPRPDQQLLPRVRQLDGTELARLGAVFQDARLNSLLFRYRARLFPDSLDSDELAQWEDYRCRRLLEDPDLASIRIDEYGQQLGSLFQTHPEQAGLLQALADWPRQLQLPQRLANQLSDS